MKRLRLALIGLALTVAALVHATPPSATALLSRAESVAAKQHKNVFVIFHASWCGWCKKLEAFMAIPKYQKMFDQNFVIVRVDVLENGDKKSLENPGGDVLMNSLGGENAGLPYMAMLNSQGKKLADSGEGRNNIGYPSAPKEIEHFMEMLKASAPKLTVVDTAAIKGYLVQNGASH